MKIHSITNVVRRSFCKQICQVSKTFDRYRNIVRKDFKFLTQRDVDYFKSFLETWQVIQDKELLQKYNVDWLNECCGSAKLVLRPSCTEDVSKILSYCYANSIAIVPQSGNTSLSHGSIPLFDEIILSMTEMNKIIMVDENSNVLTCEAGCILSKLNEELSKHGLVVPLDLGAKDSCCIGGNVATNAGGIRVIKYGSMQANVLGVEVVLPNGDIVDDMSSFRKNNTGYHLKNLFVGSEGSLGVLTKVSILCSQLPSFTNVVLFGCKKFEGIVDTFLLAKSKLGDVMSAFEYFDDACMNSLIHNLKLSSPFNRSFSHYFLIEVSSSQEDTCEDKLLTFCEEVITNLDNNNNDDDIDTVFATDDTKTKEIWKLRESITSSLLCDGYVYKYDLSIPSEKFVEVTDILKEKLQNSESIRVCSYGHLGDQNIHLNVTSRTFSPTLLNSIQPLIYKVVKSFQGSISAEHGVGLVKRDFIGYSRSQQSISLMKTIKKAFDPKGIMNPYKVLDI